MHVDVVFTLQTKGTYNENIKRLFVIAVVFTLQTKGTYNTTIFLEIGLLVVFTLQTKGTYNMLIKGVSQYVLFLPFKQRALTTPIQRISLLFRCFYPSNKGHLQHGKANPRIARGCFYPSNKGHLQRGGNKSTSFPGCFYPSNKGHLQPLRVMKNLVPVVFTLQTKGTYNVQN